MKSPTVRDLMSRTVGFHQETEKSISTIEDTIGIELAFDASPGQRQRIETAITENPEGVRRVADKVKLDLAKGTISAGIPVLLSRLEKGNHKRRSAKEGQRLSTLDWCEQAFLARNAAYPQLGPLDAIEYAIDYCPTRPLDPDELRNLEKTLAARVGHDWTALTDQRTSEIQDEHKAIIAAQPAAAAAWKAEWEAKKHRATGLITNTGKETP